MIIWCTIFVLLSEGSKTYQYETAAKGKVTTENENTYIVDFSEYAKSKGYEGDYSRYLVEKDSCTED